MIQTELIQPVGALLRRHAAERPDKIAYEDVARALSYRDLDAQTARVAGHLVDMGIVPGDRVAILLPNSVDWIVACLAISRAGAVGVPISHDATEPEVQYRLEDAACRAIFASPARFPLVDAMASSLGALAAGIVTGSAPAPDSETLTTLTLASLIETAPRSAAPDPAELDVPAYIVYTSGTTGRAKGVVLTLRSMLWVVAACWAPIAGLDDGDTILSPLPLFHSYALNLSVLGTLATGATEYLVERFSTQEVSALLASGRFTVMPGVPTMFHYLLEHNRAQGRRGFPGLRLCVSAGAIMPATLNTEFEAAFGVMLLDGYGITETATMVTMNWPVGTRVMGSCGLPVPGLATRIVSPATGLDVEFGEEGELIVRGPNLMLGYHNKPEATQEALRNGWYHTGDLARSDPNGFLTITGRLKELIIRGGQNIAPAEVEETIATYPAVLDCAVIGEPHPHLGEVPVVFVVPRPGQTVDEAGLLAHCRKTLSSYKLPQAVYIIDAVPRTGSGKIMRFKLRQTLDARPA